ncbi:MAG: hypothetical protein V4722_19590 [Bacteroidota bacterium]
MKLLLAFIPLLLVQNLFGQYYKIDPKVQAEFHTIFYSLPKEIQRKRYIFSSADSGFTIFSKFQMDTLNTKDYLYRETEGEVQLYSVDPDTNESISDEPRDDSSTNPAFYMLAGAAFMKDTLVISSNLVAFGGLGVVLKIHKDKCFGAYVEYGDSVYRYSLKSKKIDFVQVNGKIENVVLSKMPKKMGEMFYGKATFSSLPFYQDNAAFKKGYIHKRHTMDFVFSCKLSKPLKNPKPTLDSHDLLQLMKE